MMTFSFLFPEYRQRVLGLLLLNPTNFYHVREIARLTHTTPGTLHKELTKLAMAKVLIRKSHGNLVSYQANTDFPIFNELASILRKTSGMNKTLTTALLPVKNKIETALIFGSIASGKETSYSDIDILIIGNIGFIDVVKALYPAQTTLNREVNPKVYSKIEWKKLVTSKNSFATEIIKKPKIFLIGDKNDLK